MTDHVKNQLCARIEELEKDKLELNEQLDALEQGRDALAAHLERWSEWLARDPEDDEGSWMDDGWEIHASSPETSLARLKAQWQAEALGHVLEEVLTAVEADTVRTHLRNAMRKLRRQDEGGGHEH